MSKWQERLLLGFILIVAAAFRFTGIDWDGYEHFHPDERYITWVATTIEWPSDWRNAFLPTESTFNPYFWPPNAASRGIEVEQNQPRDFAYGHLPLYLGVTATRLVERLSSLAEWLPDDWLLARDVLNGAARVEFRHLTAVSRVLTGLFDVGTVWLVFLLGRRLYGVGAGLLAAAFLTVNVMHIQLAHFFISDPYLTFFVTAAVFLLVRAGSAAERGSRGAGKQRRDLLLAGVIVGLAVGSKFAAVLLLLPLGVTAWLVLGRRWPVWWGTAVFVAALTFALTNPFAVLDWSCQVITPAVQIGPLGIPALNWGSCYLENISTQGAMVRGELDLAFTRQYTGTLPYLYFIEMQLRWGMGPLLGLLAFAGFGWAVWRFVSRLNLQWPIANRQLLIANSRLFIVLAWAVPYFLTTGGFYVKFIRYLQPLTPFLMIFAAGLLWSLPGRWRWGATAVVLLGTTLFALSFLGLYRQPHPWLAASEWVHRNIEPGALILSEQWDDALPVTMVVDGQVRRRAAYENRELTWLTGADGNDDDAKLAANLALLAEADYLTLVSNRVYGVAPRLPQRYPLSSQYHPLLFAGALGYEPVAVFGRFPGWGGFYLQPDTFSWPDLEPPTAVARYLAAFPGVNWGRADESFLVYDQPLTIIFRNTGQLSAAEMAMLFE